MPHTPFEDVQGPLFGTLMCAFGLIILIANSLMVASSLVGAVVVNAILAINPPT